jgi:regulator of protease activity HflC (stomatin/prohibitin superfamily)
MSAFSWLGDFGGGLIQFLPRRTIICTNQAGVLWRFGRNPKKLAPGWYLWWPLISELEIVSVAIETVDISPQSIKTSDGKSVGVSGWLSYRVTSPLVVVVEFGEYENTLQETAAGCVASVVSRHSASVSMGQLNKELKAEMVNSFVSKGIEIKEFSLSDYFEIKYPLGLWKSSVE